MYSFKGGSDGSIPYGQLIIVDGILYGTTLDGGGTGCYQGRGCGTVFSVTPAGVEKVLYAFQGGNDGAYPDAGLTNVAGTLYGTTEQGGGSANCSTGCGTVFSITSEGIEMMVYSFQGGNDGAYPDASLTNFAGSLYGTTYFGGGGTNCNNISHCGTVFVITP